MYTQSKNIAPKLLPCHPAFLVLFLLIIMPDKSNATDNGDFRDCIDSATSYTQTIVTPYDTYTRYPADGSYQIYMPAEYGEDWWRDLYIFNAWDQRWRRIEYYRYAFLEALVQPQLTQALYEEGILSDRLIRCVSEISGNADIDAGLVSALLNPAQGIFELEPHAMQISLENWQRITAQEHLSESLGQLSIALGIVSMGGRLYADAIHDMFLHAIANADVLERIDLLDNLVEREFPLDSAEYEGYQAAREDALRYVTEDFNALSSALNSLIRNAPQNIVTSLSLANELGQQLGAISGQLGTAISQVILPYALAANVGVPLYKDLEAVRTRCAYIRLNNVFRSEEQRLEAIYRSHNNPHDELGVDAATRLLKTAHMRYAVSYAYYQKYDEILSIMDEPGDIFSIYDWIRAIFDGVLGRSGSVQQCRADIVRYLDAIMSKAENVASCLDEATFRQTTAPQAGYTNDVSVSMQFGYTSDHEGNYEVYLRDISGSIENNLTRNPAGDYLCDFSPDGSTVYFNSDRDGNSDVYALNVDTRATTNITRDSRNQYGCAVSPDGMWIVTVDSGAGNDKDIYRIKADGSMHREEWGNLTNTPGIYEHEPDWSTDGEKIVYYRIDNDGNDIWIMDSFDGRNQRCIARMPGDNHGPTMHPDRDVVLYSCTINTTSGIFYYSQSRNASYTFIDSDLEETGGEFSPDGRYVILTVGEPGDIYYAAFPEPRAIDPVPLVAGSGHDSWPIWRPIQ